ncbi:MAG: GTP 3',8-cyclase MoaA [Sulfolobales archaeon]|nr:GTP 3',8-cyclase MoaA [Sulfolobales archaeon]MDW8083501.1 GTP 3',8-cyclase MoaA [Sulfolobales archaeon]
MLRDRFGRPATHIRLSVTNRCNYSCIYCHREGLDRVDEELSPEDWDFLVGVAVKLGLKFYKITGGEPLLYGGIVEVVNSVRRHGGIPSITTNGYLLEEFAESLARAGIDHINVSIHSLKRDIYAALTGLDSLDRVLAGVEKALKWGIKLKINYLVLKPNVDEVSDILHFASSYSADINLIELIPLGVSRELYEKLHVNLDSVVQYLETVSVRKDMESFQNRTVYILPSGSRVYVIKGYGNPLMCAACSRIRIGPNGRMKLCLYGNFYQDLRPLIEARKEAELTKAIASAIEMREPYFR